MALSPKHLNDGESIVVSERTHPKALLVPVLALVVMLAIGVVSEVYVANDTAGWVVWGVLALAIVWLFVWPLLEWLSATYTVTDRRLITRQGVITTRGHDIPLSRISDVAYERDLVDRMLGCGTLVISDASTHGQVMLHDIPHVVEAQRRLNDLLHGMDQEPGGRREGH